MDVKLLRQFRQRQLAPDGGQCHLRLECRGVVPARSSAHVLSCSAAILAAGRQKLQLPRCPNSLGQLYPLGRRAAKTVNGTTTQFEYDAVNPVQELDAASPPNPT